MLRGAALQAGEIGGGHYGGVVSAWRWLPAAAVLGFSTMDNSNQAGHFSNQVGVCISERLARYGFGDGHPFGPDRHAAFVREFEARGLHRRVQILEPRDASYDELLSFHTPRYVSLVKERSVSGQGFLDAGDTPAFRGVYEA